MQGLAYLPLEAAGLAQNNSFTPFGSASSSTKAGRVVLAAFNSYPGVLLPQECDSKLRGQK